MRTKSNREKGEDFEDKVLEALGKKFSKTANSGAMFDDADIKHPEFVVECKLRPEGTKNTGITDLLILKLGRQSGRLNKDWIFVRESFKGLKLAMLDLDVLSMLIEERDHYKKECGYLEDRLDNAIDSTYGDIV